MAVEGVLELRDFARERAARSGHPGSAPELLTGRARGVAACARRRTCLSPRGTSAGWAPPGPGRACGPGGLHHLGLRVEVQPVHKVPEPGPRAAAGVPQPIMKIMGVPPMTGEGAALSIQAGHRLKSTTNSTAGKDNSAHGQDRSRRLAPAPGQAGRQHRAGRGRRRAQQTLPRRALPRPAQRAQLRSPRSPGGRARARKTVPPLHVAHFRRPGLQLPGVLIVMEHLRQQLRVQSSHDSSAFHAELRSKRLT